MFRYARVALVALLPVTLLFASAGCKKEREEVFFLIKKWQVTKVEAASIPITGWTDALFNFHTDNTFDVENRPATFPIAAHGTWEINDAATELTLEGVKYKITRNGTSLLVLEAAGGLWKMTLE